MKTLVKWRIPRLKESMTQYNKHGEMDEDPEIIHPFPERET